jgi:ribosomal protein S4
MRRFKKYKKYTFYNKSKSNHSFFSLLPQKIKSFKKTKWNSLQEFEKFPKKKFFINNKILKVKPQGGEIAKVRSFFKDSWLVNSHLNLYYNNAFKKSFWKKILSKTNTINKRMLFLSCLVYPEFKLDMLLYRLELFNSNFFARQAIQNGEVLVNNKKVSGNYILKKGDVISFLKNKHFLSLNESIKIFPFLEIDFYTKTIVLLSN